MKIKITGSKVVGIAPVSHLGGVERQVFSVGEVQGERYYFVKDDEGQLVGVRHDECELADGQPGDCFLVIALGYWGRGPTVFEAATKCRESGAKLDQKVVVRLVVGDATACVDSQGYVVRDPASRNIDIGTVKRLSTLLGNFR